MVYVASILVAIFTFVVMTVFFFQVKALEEGTDDMVEKAAIIRHGADVFMVTEYKVITPAVLIMALIFSLCIEKSSGIAVLVGAAMSSLACVIGMKAATYANSRTAHAANATRDIGEAIKVSRKGGAVAGLAVQAFGVLGFTMVLWTVSRLNPEATSTGLILSVPSNPFAIRLTSYSLGCSVVAMFNRVAGGNYTKAADISADTVAKVRFAKSVIADRFKHLSDEEWTDQLREIVKTGLPEDSFLNPSVLADFIGDCVNDIAGNCSDLLESFVATLTAAVLSAQFTCKTLGSYTLLDPMIVYVMALAVGGLLSCTLSLLIASSHHGKDPAKELNLAVNAASITTAILSLVASLVIFHGYALPDSFRLGTFSPFVASISSILAGIAIGKLTEYYTASNFRPVRRLAESAKEGAAFVVARGDALGDRSCLPIIGTIIIAITISYGACGLFGIAIAALGMLSTVAATVAIDAFGPIADNAGGLAEACCLDKEVRVITDQLDAFGNTTAAIGKGNAIGSAAFSTVSLNVAFVGGFSSGSLVLNVIDPMVTVGCFLGGALIRFFAGLLTDNTIDSAAQMADNSDYQLMHGVLAGTVKPDYDSAIRLAADGAIKKMTAPSVLALVVTPVFGLLFGLPAVGGLITGAVFAAVPEAIYMGNSGGAYDNGKKCIEAGEIPGCDKGSPAHIAAVVGDTVGDTRKDAVGVSLDIFIKMMSTVANLTTPLILAVRPV